ncbi:MAG: chaperone NapD [Bacteroidota bacterium]|nr:chaperone NapD [Bacteroidota bacterium]
MNISSVVIKTSPKNLDEVLKSIRESDFCEYHLHDEKGRIIVTIEGINVDEEVKKLRLIQAIPNVLAADLMYSYAEEELEKEKEKLGKSDSVPEWLNDENIKAEDIKYKGDLKKKL